MTAPKKRGHKRQRKIRTEASRAKAISLYLGGATQKEIATELGVQQPQVCKLIQAQIRNWQETALADTEQYVRDELERLAIIEARAWEGWESSREDAERRQVKETPEGIETTTTTEGQAGDPRFLDIALKCVQKRCDLLGLDAPKEQITYDGTIQVIEDADWYGNAERLQKAGVGVNIAAAPAIDLSNDSSTIATNDQAPPAAAASTSDSGIASEV